jgi:cell division protease FtsH
MDKRAKTVVVWLVLAVVFFVAFEAFSGEVRTESVARFEQDFTTGQLQSIDVDEENVVYARPLSGLPYRTPLRYTQSLSERAEAAHVPVGWWEGAGGGKKGSALVSRWGPLVGFFVFFLVVIRLLRNRGLGGVLGMRRTTARLLAQVPKVGFADVGGSAEAKRTLVDLVAFLKAPAAWEKSGARLPRGVLLEGPPGYGKTLLARAVAGEAKLPFFEVAASEFVELFAGIGAARVRDLFEEARKKAPCIIFIDELDAVGRKRSSANVNLSNQERELALDQLLVCLDGFNPRKGVVVIAATNRADVLDPALLRPGRFDVRLKVDHFSADDRRAVLQVHTKHKPLDAGLSLEALAAKTVDASGAELEQLCNQAAMAAAKRAAGGQGEVRVTMADFDEAIAARAPGDTGLDALDTLLTEAAAGVAMPRRPLAVKVHLTLGQTLEGEMLWADPTWLKLRAKDGVVLVSRAQVQSVSPVGALPSLRPEALLQVPQAESPEAVTSGLTRARRTRWVTTRPRSWAA